MKFQYDSPPLNYIFKRVGIAERETCIQKEKPKTRRKKNIIPQKNIALRKIVKPWSLG
jgi:hypothetical protein